MMQLKASTEYFTPSKLSVKDVYMRISSYIFLMYNQYIINILRCACRAGGCRRMYGSVPLGKKL